MIIGFEEGELASKKITSSLSTHWEKKKISQIMKNSWNSTIFHEPTFLQYHPKIDSRSKYFCMESAGEYPFHLTRRVNRRPPNISTRSQLGRSHIHTKITQKITELTREFIVQIQSLGVKKFQLLYLRAQKICFATVAQNLH